MTDQTDEEFDLGGVVIVGSDQRHRAVRYAAHNQGAFHALRWAKLDRRHRRSKIISCQSRRTWSGMSRLRLSVKGGGHNIAGTSLAEQGVALDLARMRDITVDAATRRIHVGPGCLLQDVDRATQRHGLATVLGFISEVGVAGLTLGGGFGYLMRRFGWAVDNLHEVQIVTADGAIRTANREINAELFWALRGGGGTSAWSLGSHSCCTRSARRSLAV